jgi:hypothetical protein
VSDEVSVDQLYTAIKNADKAGDSDSVKKLGEYLKTVQAKSAEKAAPWGPATDFKGSQNPLVDTAMSYGRAVGHALRSEGEGAADPLVGIAQAVGHVVGQGDRADEMVQKREASIAAERAKSGETGTDAWRTVGNVMAPTNYVMPVGAGANALTRIATTALSGGAANATMPVTSGDFWTEKAKQFGVGTATGGALGAGGELLAKAVKPVTEAVKSGIDGIKRWLGAEMPSSLQSGAVHKVLEQFGADEAAGGPKLTQVMDLLNTAREAGKPMTLADLGGENVKSLAGYVTRQPGEAMTTARNVMAERDKGAAARLSKDITEHVTSGPSMKQTADALTTARASAARPLYEEAMKPGSAAPLEGQLSAEFGRIQSERAAAEKALADAERGVTGAAAKASQAGHVGDLSMRAGDAKAGAQAAVDAAKAKLAALDAQEAKTTEILRESQDAAAKGQRGGVWSPRIQQFLDDPILKQGISKGLQVQRLEALAKGETFNAADYAITGTDKAGEPVVGKVPNMRLLDSAKRGLDEILEGYRDKTTGRLVLDQRGRAIDQVRQAFVGELDRLNPSYKVARASWSGPSQSIDAMKMGSDIFNLKPEQIAENFARLSPNDQEFFKLGVADKLRERIAKTGIGGDEAKKIMGNEWLKGQLRPIFKTQAEFDKFIDAATMESKMFDTAFRLKGGSHTAERLAADQGFGADVEAAGHGVGAAKNALTGNLFGAARDMWKMRQALGWRKNQALNAEIAKLLFDPSLTQNALQKGAGMRLLQNFPGPATQNYLSQGIRNTLSRAAPAAAVVANQGVQQ